MCTEVEGDCVRCTCEDEICPVCEAAIAERDAHVADGWDCVTDWGKFLLDPGKRVIECKPSGDGQSIFYKTHKI